MRSTTPGKVEKILPKHRGRRRDRLKGKYADCFGPSEIRFPVSLLRFRINLTRLRSLRLHPRRRPLPSTGTGPPRSDRRSVLGVGHHVVRDLRLDEVEDRLQRQLLLLPTLCRFLRLSFRFSLLRHCCPPSFEWMAILIVQSRIDSHSSRLLHRKKITVTPLNFVYRRRRPTLCARHFVQTSGRQRGKLFYSRGFSNNFPYGAEMPMECGFSKRH